MRPMYLNSIGQKFIWARLHFLDHFWIYQGPKGAFWPPIPFSGAPFSVGCCFGQNIGVWGVQTVATECPDHLAHLQPILNLPVGENVQKCPFGGFKRPKMPKKKVPGSTKMVWKKAKKYHISGASPYKYVEESETSFCPFWPLWGLQRV